MQKVSNPVPRIRHPDWLLKRTASTDDKTRQYRITEMFSKKAHIVVDSAAAAGYDSEDMDMNNHDDDDIHLLMEDGQGDGLMDMEDFGSGVGSSSSNSRLRPPVVTSRKRLHQDSARAAVAATKPATLAAVVEEDEPDYGEMPDPQIDYSGWLVFQKRKWKKQKIARRQRAQMIVDSGGAGQLGAGNIRSGPSIANFFRQENIAILSGTWEVLEIVQTDMPGEFRIFAIVNQTMHSFRLIIPRIIYINNRTEDTSLSGSLAGMTVEKCSSILPRSHPSFNLYRLTMSERVYLSSLPLLTSVYTHQDVEGVYEAQVPLLFRALINLGARVSVKRTSGRELMGIDEGFELEDLNKQPLDSKQYLRDYSINYLTLFHTKAGSRQTYALFSSCSETVHVAYVDAARNLDQIPNMERYYRERFDRYLSGQQEMKDDLSEEEFAELDSSKVFQYSEHLDFQTRVFSTDAQARAHINKCLQEHKDDKKGPTILVIGSPLAASHLMDGIFMIRDFPCKQIALPQTMTQLDAIGWQTQSIRKIMALYFTVEQWLGDQIQLANYADVPLCNIENDWSLALMDLFLARKLQKQDMVLWYSPSEKPDLGGRQEDENRSVLTLGSDIEINLPGSYNNVTLDISLSNLAFNTIVQAALVNEMEGCTTSLGNEPQLMDAHLKGKPHMLSSNYNQLNPNTFSIIRNMVKSWWMQMEAFRNMPHLVKWHSSMLQNFHRWLKSTGAKLHDPALLQMVNDLMKKVFLQLLGRKRKEGGECGWTGRLTSGRV